MARNCFKNGYLRYIRYVLIVCHILRHVWHVCVHVLKVFQTVIVIALKANLGVYFHVLSHV